MARTEGNDNLARHTAGWTAGPSPSSEVCAELALTRSSPCQEDSTVFQALENGLFPCEQCCGDDHVLLSDLNPELLSQRSRQGFESRADVVQDSSRLKIWS